MNWNERFSSKKNTAKYVYNVQTHELRLLGKNVNGARIYAVILMQ